MNFCWALIFFCAILVIGSKGNEKLSDEVEKSLADPGGNEGKEGSYEEFDFVDDGPMNRFAFAKRPQFAFAKRGNSKFAFAKRQFNSFAFAKRPYDFAFGKAAPNFAFARK